VLQQHDGLGRCALQEAQVAGPSADLHSETCVNETMHHKNKHSMHRLQKYLKSASVETHA